MNYLAHAYLSGDDRELLVGNFIADAVKGKAMDNFADGIKRGIVLHRAIDDYTDNHPLHKVSRVRLRERYGHYSGVLVDIFYDHFLAKNWSNYSAIRLLDYTMYVFGVMEENEDVLPERINYMLQFMVPQNWLLNYANLEGIRRVLRGMANRARFESNMENGVEDLILSYGEFEADFTRFFPDLQEFVHHKISAI